MSELECMSLVLTAAPNDPGVREPGHLLGPNAISTALRDADTLEEIERIRP